VEALDVEVGAELGPGLVAEAEDLALAHLVGQRLPRHPDVAVHLDHDLLAAHGRMRVHEVDRLLARPAQCVQPGVDDQPAGTPGVAGQHSEAVEVGFVEAHLVGEALGVQRPSLDERGVAPRQPAEGREVGALGGDGELEVMPGDGLVVRDRGRLGPPPLGRLVEVHEVLAGPAAVGSRR
jgi:hypothetical protein